MPNDTVDVVATIQFYVANVVTVVRVGYVSLPYYDGGSEKDHQVKQIPDTIMVIYQLVW